MYFSYEIKQLKIIKTRTAHAREGGSRKTRDGAGDDDIHDESIGKDLAEVKIELRDDNCVGLNDNDNSFVGIGVPW